MALIAVLIDGVGLAPAGPGNPVAAGMARLRDILGMPLDDRLSISSASLYAASIDANLGVAGLPQSGSGHTAIWGGFNAPALNGRHQPGFPTLAMRERLAERNLLQAALERGRHVAWANVYLPGYDRGVERRRLRHTAGTWAALYAGLPLRGLAELEAGAAVGWDVTQRLARTRPGCGHVPEISAPEGGARLARLARSYDLVAFETYLPDLAGHGRISWPPAEALEVVDGLLAGVVDAKRPDDTLVVTSDHGNVEEATTRVHTRRPVPLLAIGPAAGIFAGVRAIDQVMDAILQAFQHDANGSAPATS